MQVQKPPPSPRFDERGGVQKDFGMGKFRKSQKIMRKNKELKEMQLPPPPEPPTVYSERAVDVPHHAENIENVYQPPGPDRREVSSTQQYRTSKSVQNTPKQVRREKVNHSSRFSRSRSLPHRRVKNFVPFDA